MEINFRPIISKASQASNGMKSKSLNAAKPEIHSSKAKLSLGVYSDKENKMLKTIDAMLDNPKDVSKNIKRMGQLVCLNVQLVCSQAKNLFK